MAEFLIYNKDHWSKSVKLTTEQVEKFSSCYKKGDVVEVQEDGFWDKRGINKTVFVVVKKPGMLLKGALMYVVPLYEKDSEKILARRKYQITNVVENVDKKVVVDELSIITKTAIDKEILVEK